MSTQSNVSSLHRTAAQLSVVPLSAVELSVVIPVCNEAENVAPLAREIHAALSGRMNSEVIFVDDGSTDATVTEILKVRAESVPQIRLLKHARRSGQSAAMRTGVRAARGQWIATLDGDGQNDPADIPKLLTALQAHNTDGQLKLIVGNRTTRRDTWLRVLSSRIANGVRAGLLDDGTPDTGCGIKLFERQMFLELPHFNHMHRFMPALVQRAGMRVLSVPVAHRQRTRGVSKYGLHNRLWVGIVDLFGVMWLIKRRIAAQSLPEE